jgi:hypothetical protein
MSEGRTKYASLGYALPMLVGLTGVAGATDTCPIVGPGMSLSGVAVGLVSHHNAATGTQTLPRILLQNLSHQTCAAAVVFFDNFSNELGRVEFTLAAFLQGPDAVTVCPTSVTVGGEGARDFDDLCSHIADQGSSGDLVPTSTASTPGDFEGKAVICVERSCEEGTRPSALYAQSENLELDLVVDEASGYNGFAIRSWNKGNVSFRGTGRSK